MPRQPRIEYEGALYHVLSRGDRREDIVLDDDDRQHFVQTLGAACAKCDWQVHAWVLLSNHFHLVIETPLGNLSTGMKWLLGTYTMRFNRRHQLSGHLFAGRYKSLLIDDGDPHYLRTVCDYVHLNPARAHMIAGDGRLESYGGAAIPTISRRRTGDRAGCESIAFWASMASRRIGGGIASSSAGGARRCGSPPGRPGRMSCAGAGIMARRIF